MESLGQVKKYIKGMAKIENHLPEQAQYCQYCRYISYHSAYERHYCKITDEWIFNFKLQRGSKCPFVWKDE